MLSKLSDASLLDRFELWSVANDFDLLTDLATYYAACCAFGFVSGLAIGQQMLWII